MAERPPSGESLEMGGYIILLPDEGDSAFMSM